MIALNGADNGLHLVIGALLVAVGARCRQVQSLIALRTDLDPDHA